VDFTFILRCENQRLVRVFRFQDVITTFTKYFRRHLFDHFFVFYHQNGLGSP